jgi:putative hydrolase of the HAD superfamily
MIRTIFFDFGNVVAFFDHSRAIAQMKAFTDMPPVELALALYGNPLEDDYECGKLSTAEYVRLAKLSGRLTCSEESFLAAFVDIFTANAEVCDLIPRLAPRYRLVIASNTNDAHYRKYTEQFAGALQHFKALCPSHEAGHRKPHTEYYTFCQKSAEAEPGECLFIDDMPVNIEAAVCHGWKGLLYRPGENLAQQLANLGIQFGPVTS